MSHACDVVGVQWSDCRQWKQISPAFRQQFHQSYSSRSGFCEVLCSLVCSPLPTVLSARPHPEDLVIFSVRPLHTFLLIGVHTVRRWNLPGRSWQPQTRGISPLRRWCTIPCSALLNVLDGNKSGLLMEKLYRQFHIKTVPYQNSSIS